MGLDQYLYAEKYIGGYDFLADEQKGAYRTVLEAAGMAHLETKESPSVIVKVTVAYWRKANQIHAWFVDNVQNGRDECQPHYVGREQLQELYDLANTALLDYEAGNIAAVEAVLPPRSGFFFGSTEIDEWYAGELKETVRQLKPLLEADKDLDFSYCSSW